MVDPAPHAEHGAPSQLRWVLLLGGLTALGPLAIDAYLPSLPSLQLDLHTTRALVQLTVATFFVGLGVGQLFWGPLADRFGRRAPLLAGLGMYATGSIACALAPRIELLLGARLVQALGGAAGVVIVRATVRDLWSGREAARMMSLLMLVMSAAPVLAPTIGGVLLRLGGWRTIFYFLTAAGLVAFAVTSRLFPDTRPTSARAPFGRALRVVFRDRSFLAYALASSFFLGGVFAYIAGSSFVFIDHFGLSPSSFALLFGTNAAGLIGSAQVNRRLLLRFAPPAVALASGTVACLAAVGLLAATWVEAPFVIVAALVFTFVASLGFCLPNTTATALDEQGAHAGVASAILGAVQYAVGAASAAAVSALGGGTGRGMAAVMLGCAVFAVAATLAGMRSRRA